MEILMAADNDFDEADTMLSEAVEGDDSEDESEPKDKQPGGQFALLEAAMTDESAADFLGGDDSILRDPAK
eukprot:scaffold294180_cov21-Prasinocladus_malaysianus.AAC.1